MLAAVTVQKIAIERVPLNLGVVAISNKIVHFVLKANSQSGSGLEHCLVARLRVQEGSQHS